MTRQGFTVHKSSKPKIEIPKSQDRIRQTLNLFQGKVQDLVRDESKIGSKLSCHADLVSASDLNKVRKRSSKNLIAIGRKVFSTTGFTP